MYISYVYHSFISYHLTLTHSLSIPNTLLHTETDEEIEARVTAAFADGGAIKFDISQVVKAINNDDIVGLVEKTVASMQANPNYKSKLCPQNRENADKIMKSETCHYFLLVRTLTQMVACGLAIIVEWTDDKGKTFSRIFVSVSLFVCA